MQAGTDVHDAPGVRHTHPGELAALARLAIYVDHAALLMSAAFAAADVRDFAPGRRRQTIRASGDSSRWYAELTNDVLTRLSELRNAVAHRWTSSPEADALAAEAIELLAELTPVPNQLVALYRSNREAGLAELARHLTVIDRQYALAASLVGEAGEGGQPTPDPASEGFATAREALLASAGGALSLTEAAAALGVTRQNLHKRIHAGSALGMLVDGRIVIPRLQLVPADGKSVIVAGIERIVRPFLETKAGAWSALQFLLDGDPNLGRPPIESLRAGDVAGAEHAARAYLGLDEG
jgi:hypothetical protein